MPFTFLKYLQPTHYFRLVPKSNFTVFPIPKHLPKPILEHLIKDTSYQSRTAMAYDVSWQAIQQGYIGDANTYTEFEPLSVQDNYHFIRKYFNGAWVWYVLIVRILSLNNPFKDISAWFHTRHIKRVAIGNNPIAHDNWEAFESELVRQNPKVSVLIPTLNRYAYLKAVLTDLEQQDYPYFEVIVVDQSEPFNTNFYKDYKLDITLIRQEEKALWLARNTAIRQATGECIALSEDDVRIKPDWISSHLKALDFFNADVSAGVFYPAGQSIPKDRSFFALATQFATGNAMLYKSVFKEVGLFDRQFEKQRMGDGEFGMRVYLAGIKSVSNPKASCVDVKADTGGLRDMGSWDAFRPATFFAPRPIPSVLYFFRRYFGNAAARWALLRTVPLSIFPYQFKKHKGMLILGVILSVLLMPMVCYQVYKSWQLATRKLKSGPQIERL